MPSAFLLAPVVLPLAAAGVIAAAGLAGIEMGRVVGAIGVWASVAALLALWVPVRSTQELVLGPLGFGSSFDMRIDAVAFAFGLLILVPAAVMLTFQKRGWREAALAVLCVGAAIAAVEAGGVVLTSSAGGAAATLAIVLLQTEDPDAPRPSWATLLAAWLGLAWLGVIFQVRGGTAVYSAVPVSTVTAPVFTLLAVAALLAAGLFAWRAWPARLWSRPSLVAAGIAVTALYPLGFYLLIRAYELGDGRYPNPAFNFVLAAIGVIAAFAAAARAQGAVTKRDYFSQVVMVNGGFALMALAVGTPLGLVAGLATLAATAALTGCIALLPDRAGRASLVAIAATSGLPPSFVFGSLVLGIESNLEGGEFIGLVGLGAMATWALWMVASARAIRLPGRTTGERIETRSSIAIAIAALTFLSGPALATIVFAFANPVALEVMQPAAAALGTRLSSVVTTSSVLPVLTLFLPLLIIGVLAYAAIGSTEAGAQARPAVLALRAPRLWTRVREVALGARVPDEYRSLVNLPALDAAASGGRPWLWIGALAALAFAVTR